VRRSHRLLHQKRNQLNPLLKLRNQNHRQNISIHAAARQGKIEAVKQHLTDGVGVNAKSERGRTPLHSAAREGHKEVIELLIAKGADMNAKDDDGTTPLDMADDKETADLLRKHGGKTKKELEDEGK